ncbi:MAG: alpha/beta hydrolase-fold protein [Hymenobacter sp.]
MPAQGAADFLQFLQQELVPSIDQRYRTQPYRLLMGHSLAGLFALYAKEKAPSLFQSTILISPALTVTPKVLADFKPLLEQHPQLSGKLFVAIGNENTEKVDSLMQQLTVAAPKSFQWHYQQYKAENHFSVPVPSMGDALKFVYATWFLDYYATTRLSYSDIQAHFAALSQEFGYPIAPTEDVVNNRGYRQLRLGNVTEAVGIFKQNVINHPASANAYDSLGEAYLKQGKKSLAISSYQKSIALNPANENARAVLQKLTVRAK